MAQTYRVRPSELLGIRDEIAAWSLDNAVYLFGSSLDAELKKAEAESKTPAQATSKRRRILARWLGDSSTPQYRDPAAAGSGTVPMTGSGPVQL